MKKSLILLGLTLGLVAPQLWAETYSIDTMHSSVGFRVKHVVGKVVGSFDQFTGSFSYDPAKPDAATAEATIQATSVNTGNAKRDNHLRTPDFFDVQKYPTITFKGDHLTGVQGTKATMSGQLTMHGVTKPVVLNLDIGGVMKDPMGNQRAGATVTTHVSRADFGIGATTGPMAGMIGTDIEITIEIEGVKK